jgi:hypothetical protein
MFVLTYSHGGFKGDVYVFGYGFVYYGMFGYGYMFGFVVLLQFEQERVHMFALLVMLLGFEVANFHRGFKGDVYGFGYGFLDYGMFGYGYMFVFVLLLQFEHEFVHMFALLVMLLGLEVAIILFIEFNW